MCKSIQMNVDLVLFIFLHYQIWIFNGLMIIGALGRIVNNISKSNKIWQIEIGDPMFRLGTKISGLTLGNLDIN
jgi:hypothetical protein